MSRAQELVELLRPLGVYSFREGSFSLGELQALGAALDALAQWEAQKQREGIVMTAEGEGLERMEALFRTGIRAENAKDRRAAIAGFLQIGGDSFTKAALNRCLCACGAACRVEETGEVNHVRVSFPAVMGIPEGFAQMRQVIEDILPCQLDILYYFRYCTWGETMEYALTWNDLGAMTWSGWMHYHEGPMED